MSILVKADSAEKKSLMTSGLFQKTLLICIAQFLDRLMGLLVMPLMTSSYPVSDYALWAQVIVFVGVLTPVFAMGVFNANVKFLPVITEKNIRNEINGLIAFILLAVFAAASSTFVWFSSEIALLLVGSENFGNIVLSAMLLLFSELIFEYAVSVQRAQNNIKIISKSLILKSLFRAGVLCSLCFYIQNIETLIHSYSLSMMFFSLGISGFLLSDNISFKARISQRQKLFLRNVIAHCVPLLLVNVLIGANSLVDRLILVQFKNNILVGQYAVNFSVISLIGLVYSALSFSLLPHLRHEMLKPESSYIKDYYSLMNLYLSLVIFYSIYLTLFGELFVELISNDSYVIPKIEILIMCCNVCLIGAYYIASFPVILSDSPRALVKLYFQTFFIHLCLSLLLVADLDLLGVLIGGLMSQVFLVMQTLSKVSKIYESSIIHFLRQKWILSHVCLLLIALCLNYNFDMNYYFAFFAAVAFGGLFLFANRDSIAALSKKTELRF